MVKSKKMSKTGIAVIVLAINMVLSMIMGMTGAWYTNKATDSMDAKQYEFKLDEYFSLVVGAHGDSSLVVTRTEANGSTTTIEPEEEGDNEGKYMVLPGDDIVASATTSLSISASGAPREFYYVYKITGNSAAADASHWYASGGHSGSETEALLGNNETVINVASIVDNLVENGGSGKIERVSENHYQVLESLTTAACGSTFTLSVGGVAIEVRTIQAQNITAAAAYSHLINDSNFSA